jgi:hypothetical protein
LNLVKLNQVKHFSQFPLQFKLQKLLTKLSPNDKYITINYAMIDLICMELNFYSRKLSLVIELKKCRSELQMSNYKEKSFPLYIPINIPQ